MLGLLNVCHAFVVFHRFRQRCRSRVTDGVAVVTARIYEHTKRKVQGIVLDQKRGCAQRGREREEKKNGGDGRKGGRDDLNAWLT